MYVYVRVRMTWLHFIMTTEKLISYLYIYFSEESDESSLKADVNGILAANIRARLKSKNRSPIQQTPEQLGKWGQTTEKSTV